MADPKLTKAQRSALAYVCATNGGGVRIKCKIGDDGYGIPANAAYRKLHELGLVQGKSGGIECIVHTREGWALNERRKAIAAATGDAK